MSTQGLGKTPEELARIFFAKTVPIEEEPENGCHCGEAFLDLYDAHDRSIVRRRLSPETDHHDCAYVKARNRGLRA